MREGEVNTEKRNRRSTPEGAKVKSASKREQRKCIYSAEREQVQDREAGLKRRTVRTYPLRHFVPLSSVALGSFPRVALESAPLKGHESIFDTFSKGPFRPSEGTEAHSVLLLKTLFAP